MADLKETVRRRPNNNNSKVNRIVSLFEIPRPNKQRGLQRTNSLPASSRTRFFSSEDEGKTTQTKGIFSKLYNSSGRVKKIKEEIEQKNEDTPKASAPIRKTPRPRRKKFDSEGNMDNVLEDEKQQIMQNLLNIGQMMGRIQVVTEDIEQSDTEVELTVNKDVEDNDNVFDTCHQVLLMDAGTVENNNSANSRLSDSIVDDSDNTVVNQDLSEVGYGEYELTTGTKLFSRSTSSDSESLNSVDSMEVDGQDDKKSEKNEPTDNDSEDFFPTLWMNNVEIQEYNENNFDNGTIATEIEKKITEESKDSEVDSLSWWTHKSFVQVNNERKTTEEEESSYQKHSNDNSESSTQQKNRRFIKNQAGGQRTRRRTGILAKAQSVKEIAQQFEGFKEAAEKGETEHYRKSFIDEMDKEIEKMRSDGFEDNFHLSFENLAVFDQDDERMSMKSSDDDDTHLKANLDEELNAANQNYETAQFFQKPFEDNATDDDLFGETLFSEDLEHGLYYIESFNADGKELIVCSVQVDRKSVDLNSFDEVRDKMQSNVLAQQDDDNTLILIGVAEVGQNHNNISSSESNCGTDSKRTTIYSTTSGDSFDDRITDDEGIDTETSSNSYKYSSARRETYCDDHGIVRIERIAPYDKSEEEVPEGTLDYHEEENEREDVEYEEIEIPESVTEVKKEKLQYIIEEIRVTERKYVEDMEWILEEYKPFLEERCPDKVDVVFGNMDYILRKQHDFLEALEDSGDEVRNVVDAFIDSENLFKLYPRYFKNTPKANIAIKELSDLVKEKQEQLNDRLHLSAYLLTPLQRLGKYKLFLENIIKQFVKEDKPIGIVEMALEIIKKYMSRGNDAVAVASILHSPLHLKDYGSFVTREKFMLIKPRRMEFMVFLFQEAIIFTTEDPRNMEQFIYWQSIKTNDLRIATFDDTTIHLTDYTKTKRRNSSKHTYILDAKSQKVKNAWKQEIEEILWRQLKKVKENTIKEYQSGKKTPSIFGRNRVKSTGSSVFYIE